MKSHAPQSIAIVDVVPPLPPAPPPRRRSWPLAERDLHAYFTGQLDWSPVRCSLPSMIRRLKGVQVTAVSEYHPLDEALDGLCLRREVSRVLVGLSPETVATLEAGLGSRIPVEFEAYGQLAPLIIDSARAVEEYRHSISTKPFAEWLRTLPLEVRRSEAAKGAFRRLIAGARMQLDLAVEAYVEMRRRVGRGR